MTAIEDAGQVRAKCPARVSPCICIKRWMRIARINSAEAEHAYRAVLDAAPDCFEALHFLSLAYLQQNKLPEALDARVPRLESEAAVRR